MPNLDDIDGLYIIVSLVYSAIGFVYFTYGKKMQRFWFMAAGGLLMFFVYFVETTMMVIILGALIMASPFVAERIG